MLVGCWLTLPPVCLKVDPKTAVPDDVSQRGVRGGGGGGAPETKKTNKVFVGGVPHEMDEETISNYFKKFGEVSVVGLSVYNACCSGPPSQNGNINM